MDADNGKSITDPPLPKAAIAALHLGNKIAAIKIVREEQKLGLKEAKDIVEHYVRSQPALGTALATASDEAKRSALIWLVALVAAVILGYVFLSRS